MQEKILELAKALSGAGEEDGELLALLCGAAEISWTARLREGVTPEACGGAFLCAAAMTAAADLAAARMDESMAGFTAGAVSIRTRDTGSRGTSLRQAAERLMEPYASAGDFAFKGVKG